MGTMGSGSLAAMAVFEQGWREDITEEEAIALVKDAILAGIFNDLGSGSNCDITIIRKGGETERIRGYEKPNDVAPIRAQYGRPAALHVPNGVTEVLSTQFLPLSRALVIEDAAAPMAL